MNLHQKESPLKDYGISEKKLHVYRGMALLKNLGNNCDRNGFVLGVKVTPGNVHDSQVFEGCADSSESVKGKTLCSSRGHRQPQMSNFTHNTLTAFNKIPANAWDFLIIKNVRFWNSQKFILIE